MDLLKQDVAKWEEAARAVEALLHAIPESDRLMWLGRSTHYRNNAKTMRSLLDELAKGAA